MRKSYDFAIIGAGSGGSVAAATAARLGHSVLLIDQKPRARIGDKVCGEAVGRHHFDKLGIQPPKGEELAGSVVGINVASPDQKTVLRIKGEGLRGFTLNRLAFGQRLLNEALDEGSELLDNTMVSEPIIRDKTVAGIRCRSVGKAENMQIGCKLLVDASGMNAVARRCALPEWGVENGILNEDLEILYMEIREVQNIEDEEYLRIYLNQAVAPGGYYWIFPKGRRTVNVGIGTQKIEGFPNPKLQLEKYVLSQGFFRDSKRIRGGGGILSTRRPLNCLVGNGVLFVGDSACMPNPIHGGGIGPSMIAGKLAAGIGSKALNADDVRRESLWSYNTEYMKSYGAKAAGLDVFRMFLLKSTDEDLNYGLSTRLVIEDDIRKACMGEDLRLNITEKARRAFRGIRRLSFLRTLGKTAEEMKRMKALYRNYPSPVNHREWVAEVSAIVSKMKTLEL